jgi:hypothetical protein
VIECPQCGSSDLNLIEDIDDGRKLVGCTQCGYEWTRGEAKRVYRKIDVPRTVANLRGSFPKPEDVPATNRARADALKEEFLRRHPHTSPRTKPFREKYRRLFSKEALATASPEDLKYFANANIGANPGNMSVFNTEWNRLGPADAASRVRDAIEYLLYGPEDTYIEDRLTNLINGERGFGMKGFREALLTKVLCMAEPQRFIPILVYTGKAGKHEVVRALYGLSLPDPESVSWTIGRLIFWSNDLLRELVGPGFEDGEHAGEFLWTSAPLA